jgi:hypothetical protein
MDELHRCERVVDSADGRGQCSLDATWRGSLHAGRDIYVVECCDRHKSGLIDAEPLDGNWDRTLMQPPKATPR